MADTLDLLTLAEAKTALNMSGSTHDTELAQWITAISRRIDKLCGSVVQRTVSSETLDGGTSSIRPVKAPISSVTTLTEYSGTTATVLTAETNASKPDDSYMLESYGGDWDWVIRRRAGNTDGTFAVGRRNIDLAYVGGRYADTASVDAKFKLAAGAILRRLWQREQGAWARGADPFEVGAGGMGTVGFFKAVDPMVTELLHEELRPVASG